jgi:ribose/xylose/arabinose/galactoside ABC-type transport system permease subunit
MPQQVHPADHDYSILGPFIGTFNIDFIEASTVVSGLIGFWTQLIHRFIIVLSVIMQAYLGGRIE